MHPEESESGSISAILAWLGAIRAARDFGLSPPVVDARTTTIGARLALFSREIDDYRAVVTVAYDAARRNAGALMGVVEATAAQRALVHESARAVTEATVGARSVAASAETLAQLATSAGAAANAASEGMAETSAALEALLGELQNGRAPLEQMSISASGVSVFLASLGRLSRQAQLLSVNAAIESAHLADAGARFAIVAMEVRALSVTTRDSAADVRAIVGELRATTLQVGEALDTARAATSAAAREITAAATTLVQTQRSIGDFEETIVQISDVANAQATSLAEMGAAIEAIARHADEAAQASSDAALLDLAALIARADETSGRWNLQTRASGNADRVPTGDVLDPEIEAELALLTDAVNTDEREILADVVNVAIAVARNGFAWTSIATSLDGLHAEIDAVRVAVEAATSGARRSAELSASMRTIVLAMEAQYDAALGGLEEALTRVGTISRSAREMSARVDAVRDAAARADEILGVIDTLSSETDLLSLNAAIEAAHAGDVGRGFGVIAEEIRVLASSTHTSTTGVSDLIKAIASIGTSMHEAIGEIGAGTDVVSISAEHVREAIGALRASFEGTLERALNVSSTADAQSRALDRVRENVARSAQGVDADRARSTDAHRLELATLGSRAHAIAARRPIGIAAEGIRALADAVCAEIEDAIEQAIVRGTTTAERLFDFSYREIEHRDAHLLRRLFDVSRVPEIGFRPKKYVTPWDATIDASIIAILDAAMDRAAWFRPLTMLTMDLNAFLYAYPKRDIADWRDDASDLAGNRIKRINDDDYTVRLARWGLGANVATLGFRVGINEFRRVGADLERHGERPWGIYAYGRDTANVYNGLAMGYFVRGVRHGTFRIIYDTDII